MTTWRDRYVRAMNTADSVAGVDPDCVALAAEIRAGITAGLLDQPDPATDRHVEGGCYCRYRAAGELINLDPRCGALYRPAEGAPE